MTSGRRRSSFVLLLSAVSALASQAARGAEAPALEGTRRELASIEQEQLAVEVRSDSLRAAAERVALELADLEREQNLGPVKRAQLSLYRQQSQSLAESRSKLDQQHASLERRYARVAERLLPLLDSAIDTARAAYEGAQPSSRERARYFRDFERLVLERRAVRARLYPTPGFILLDISIDPDDTVKDLRRKTDLLADNRDILAQLLGRLGSWKRELEIDRTILADSRKLREENEFFNQTDPLAPSLAAERQPGIAAEEAIPQELGAVAERFDVPAGGLATEEDYDRLIQSVARLEAELEDEILAMDENQKMIEREIARRERVE